MCWLYGHQLPQVANTVHLLLLAFHLAHTHSLLFLFLENHVAGLGQDEHAQKDDEDSLVHSQSNKKYLIYN